MSGIDYCISLLDGAPKTLTDKLQRVMNVTARITSNTRKFDHGLMQLRRAGLFRSQKDIVICGHRAAVNSSYLVTV